MRRWLSISVPLLCAGLAFGQSGAGRLRDSAPFPNAPLPAFSPRAHLALAGGVSTEQDKKTDSAAQEAPRNSIAPQTGSGPGIAPGQSAGEAPPQEQDPAVWTRHFFENRYWVSGQANFIFQAHEPFHSPYAGTNSFQSNSSQTALSRVLTLYTGVKLRPGTEFIFDLEETGGKGVGQALGIAAYTNLDVVRNPSIGQNVYLARYFLRQTFPIGGGRIEAAPDPLSPDASSPRRRIAFLMGKISLVDFFDVNAVGGDSHLQFTNWAIDNNGAYDYAADTRGYTLAAMLSYQGPRLGVRFAEALMPTVANGMDLDYALRRARSENFELDWQPRWFRGLDTHVRPLAYLNHANMGDYRQAIDGYLGHLTPIPDITLYRHQGTLKQGFGINLEQDLPDNFRAFFRAGWNEGHHESFAYTEMNNTVAFGADLAGDAWGRRHDRIGSAFETGGLSREHREYLALGGLGFILGDGRLNYGREEVSETYYTAHIAGGLSLALQLSVIDRPGYNRDRGPVIVPGVRAHIDF